MKKTVKDTLYFALMVLLVGVGSLSLLLYIFAPGFVSLFNLGKDSFKLSVECIHYFALSLILLSLNEMIFDYLQAVRKFKLSHIYIVFQRFTIVPVAYILIRLFGPSGLFMSFIVSEASVLIITGITLILINERECGNILNSLLCIPKRFLSDDKNTLRYEIKNIDEIEDIAKVIEDFSVKNGIDSSRSSKAALCFEEMAVNIVEHGFTKNNREHNCYFFYVNQR